MTEKPRTLLVVDDEPLNVKLLKARFSHVGYTVLEALSGEEALRKAESQPDLILLDVMMPGMNGFETCGRLKENPRTKDIPVIFISAVDDAIIKVNGLELGGVDYIAKPFDAAELLTRVRTHLRLRDQERKLTEYATRLEQMVEARTSQLVHADRLATLGTMAAAVVHEINTPLTYIGGNVELLKTLFDAAKPILERHIVEDKTDGVAQLLQKTDSSHKRIFEGLTRIERIVANLRMYSAGGTAQREPCRLLDAVQDAVRLLGHRIRAGVGIGISVPDDFWMLCDRQKMSQVFVNLFSNAIDAMGGAEGEISVVAGRNESDRIEILVKDTGPGIPGEIAESIFEPFATTKPQGQGTGLGLFIVRSIIEECGGSVTLAPFDGGGAAFHLTLPAHR
jgi:two-component system, NtrC family, sensor kinase